MSKYMDNDLEFMDVNADDVGGNDGNDIQLSAEEIAAVLADTYMGSVVETEQIGERDSEEEEQAERGRSLRRQQRIQQMKRKKRQQERMRKLLIPCVVAFVICVFMAGTGIRNLVRKHGNRQNMKGMEIVNASGLKDQESDESDSGERSSDGKESEDSTADRVVSNKDISYNNSLNVAGCYVGNAVADGLSDDIAQLGTLFVQTLGGNSSALPLNATADEATSLPDSEVVSENGIFIDVEAGRILGQKDAGARISPASMTKILTVLVAAEHITDPDDTFEITADIVDYSFANQCSNAGFEVGEKVTVRDLFYGTVLPSGADAALGLAVYAAGSQEAFVDLMNEKIDALGLSRTSHFTNCIGLYDENHYSTVYDVAVMLKAACDNSFCREVLSAHTYTTSATEQHPEGITISNWFLRRIEDKDTHGEVLCAKTGYVVQSGNCAASLSAGKDGREYICVTAHSSSTWRCIYDHVALCQQFMPGDEGAVLTEV